MSAVIADVIRVYQGSDGEATKALYARLVQFGAPGEIAINLFRAQKASERAKVYRRGYRGMAYDKKQWSMDNLCAALTTHGADLVWGWGEDEKQAVHRHVLYIDLPTGQASFHTDRRGAGPDYPGAWDGVPGQGPDRIIRFVARVIDGSVAA